MELSEFIRITTKLGLTVTFSRNEGSGFLIHLTNKAGLTKTASGLDSLEHALENMLTSILWDFTTNFAKEKSCA